MTQAVILAGGKGTRLAAMLNGKPKCLVDVDGTPLLQRQIELLSSHGIDNILLLVNHAADYVAQFLAEKSYFGIEITLLDDGNPRGTSGAVLEAFSKLDKRFIVIYGDTLLNVDLQKFIAAHVRAGGDATLFLHPNDHPADSDLVEIDADGWIREFHAYPHDPARYYANLVNAALYVVEKSALSSWLDFKVPSDFGKDLFPAMLEAGARLKGYLSFEYIKDVGTPARLLKAGEQLRNGLVGRACLTQRQKAVFLDRDGTMNYHRGFIRSAEAFELMPGVAAAVKKLNEAEYRVVLVTNQPVISRGDATFEEVYNIHAKLETELGNAGAFLDALYICPHHPDRGFVGEIVELKKHCNCRKPNTGMIDRAVRELNVDLTQSWLIGDTTLDLETSRRAGVKSILVRTGIGGHDAKYSAESDYTSDTLGDAVDLIIAKGQATS